MMSLKNSSRISMWALIVLLAVAGAGCKSKKKAMAVTDPDAEKAKMEQEAAMQKQREEEERRQRELEEKRRAEEEARKERAPYVKLENYFSSISNAASVSSANGSIAEALTLFASKDTPVLIVISESGGQKDYDRPTTIGDYLNYLKDQKKNVNRISDLKFDDSGKITEVELVKQ